MSVGHAEAPQHLHQVNAFGPILPGSTPWIQLPCVERYLSSSRAQPQTFFQHYEKKCGGGLGRSNSYGYVFIRAAFKGFGGKGEYQEREAKKFDIGNLILTF